MPFACTVVVVCAFAPKSGPTAEAGKLVTVEVKRRTTDKQWRLYDTRLLEHLVGFVPEQIALSKYGGLKDAPVEATGFFHVRKIDGRWWLVDPQGCLFLTVGVCSVGTNPTERGRSALRERFGDEAGWSRVTNATLWEMGYNTLGCWSQWEKFVATEPRLPYTTQSNFMSSYGKIRGGTYQKPGHTGYPNDCIFVFDPQFTAFCERHAREWLSATKSDPYLLGHFSDNEMPFRHDLLDRYLSLDESDPGHQAARKWRAENGVEKGPNGFATRDRETFIEFVAATYFRTVSQAIKKADPNHLYLGSRFHGSDLKRAAVWKGAGPYVDAIAVNYYGAWTPDPERMTNWVAWSGKPFFITEWYAKGMDSGLGNISGAGWTVKTQADRGKFYQNFTLGLLEHAGCVGWHWFKYMDNDPTNLRTDPSNRDSNKGFVSNTYELWTPLVEAMAAINRQVYPLREFLSGRLLIAKPSGKWQQVPEKKAGPIPN